MKTAEWMREQSDLRLLRTAKAFNRADKRDQPESIRIREAAMDELRRRSWERSHPSRAIRKAPERRAQYHDGVPRQPGYYVYRCWARDGTCLYVGKSHTPSKRLNDHKTQKPWWSQVARIDVASLPTAIDASDEEHHQIAEWQPVHNRRLLRGAPDLAEWC